jgi:phosphate transport system permease protein
VGQVELFTIDYLLHYSLWIAHMSLRTRWRKFVNVVMLSLTGVCALFTVSALFFILGYLVWYGGKSLNWAFFTQLPAPVGETGGGMANAIVGSGKLLLLASLVGVPIGLLGGVYLAEFGGRTFSFFVRYTADLLNGVPSIVMGIFAYTIIVIPMKHFSAFAGGMALGVMMIPIAVRTTEESLRAVPLILREGALALGASKWKTVATVVMPAAIRGIVTGIMLTLARVAGETAPLLFTAFGNRFWSSGWNQPIASLPVMIYTYAVGPYEDWHRQAWAAGLVLLALVLIANLGARLVVARGISFRRA